MRTARWQCRSLGAAPDLERVAATRPLPPNSESDWEGRGGPSQGRDRGPLARPRPGAAWGSTVGKLRAPGSIRHTARHGWAGRRVRALFVCDHWGARVEASSCLHVLCVCALSHAWIPVRPCAREHARAVWTRACACLCVPGVLRPRDAHGSGVPASGEPVCRSKCRAHRGSCGSRPCPEAQPLLRLSE